MKAMILAAGLGTRLAPFTHHHPKALAKIGETTLLEWNIRYLQAYGIRDVIVNVHHFADQIEEEISRAKGWGSKIQISNEREELLDTGGGLLKAAPFFQGESSFLVMNVDVVTDLKLSELMESNHLNKPLATLAVMKRASSRFLLFDENLRLCGWKNEKTGAQKGRDGNPFAFTGVQVMSSELLNNIKRTGKFSLVDVYLDAIADGGTVIGFDHSKDRFLDVGKPETLESAPALFADKPAY